MNNSRFTTAIFLSVFFICILLMVHLFWQMLTPIVLALVLASLFYPAFRWCEKVVKSRVLAASIITVLIVLCAVLPMAFFTVTLSNQALEFYQNVDKNTIIPKIMDVLQGNHPVLIRIRQYLEDFGINPAHHDLASSSAGLIRSLSLLIYENISDIASNLVLVFVNFFLMMALVFTLFASGEKLKQFLLNISPLPLDEQENLIARFNEISYAVFLGNGVVAILFGIFGGLGMYWFELGPGTFWGVVIAFASFLPVLGTFVVIIPAAVYLYFSAGLPMAIGFVAYNVAYLVTFEMLMKAFIIGGRARMHPVLVFFAVFAGIQVYGVLGLFYGPLIVTMLLSLADIYKEHYKSILM